MIETWKGKVSLECFLSIYAYKIEKYNDIFSV